MPTPLTEISAGCDNPTTPEIYDCIIQGLKLAADIEVRYEYEAICRHRDVKDSVVLVFLINRNVICVLQRKRHPRDWKFPGRVRVQLKDENGKPVNPDVPDRKFIFS